jgi:pSer/pThr/pTyr-binding forkhead associated (FHA) protein
MSRQEPDSGQQQLRSSTFLESFDSWAQLLRQSDAGQLVPGRESSTIPPDPQEAALYRPTLRRPMALLHIVDDGREEGETVRVRSDELVIGRSEGDVVIPNDISMSTRHARIARLPEGGWELHDLGSASGTFVRVMKAKLKNGSVLQIGATRFRFEMVDPTGAALVEIVAQGVGARHECQAPATAIGRIHCGADVAVDDPFVSPLHAELRRTPGGWRIENRGINGLWVRIESPVRLSAPSQFQCGEQRFVFVPAGD